MSAVNPADDVSATFVSIHSRDGAQPVVRVGSRGGISVELSTTNTFHMSGPRELLALLETIRQQVHRLGAGGAGLV